MFFFGYAQFIGLRHDFNLLPADHCLATSTVAGSLRDFTQQRCPFIGLIGNVFCLPGVFLRPF